MTFLAYLAGTIVACCVLRTPIARAPWAFYTLAVAYAALYLLAGACDLPRWLDATLLSSMDKCLLPTALFVLVMYVGVIPNGTAVRRWLQPLRGPLSVIACVLVLGHMARFFPAYAARLFAGGTVGANVIASAAMGAVMFLLLAALGPTSLACVHRRMAADTWKRLQRLAYPFYALIYAHLLVMLGPSALAGGTNARVSLAVYTLVFGGYAVARVAQTARKRRAGAQPADPSHP